MFSEVNENDARASVKAWSQAVARQREVALTLDALIIPDSATMVQAFRAGQANAAAMPITEFAVVSRDVTFSHLFIASLAGSSTEEYVVLVHRDSAITRLAQLGGCDLLLHKNPRTDLAEPWLDLQLLQAGRPGGAAFFRRILRPVKLSKVVLPVFFRQADACLVTRRSFAVMSELNPQIGQQLRVIAASPPLVSMVLGIQAGYEPALLAQIVASMRDLHTTPAGQQVLTIFQSERLEEIPAARLAASLALLAEYAHATAPAAPRVEIAARQSRPKEGAN